MGDIAFLPMDLGLVIDVLSIPKSTPLNIRDTTSAVKRNLKPWIEEVNE